LYAIDPITYLLLLNQLDGFCQTSYSGRNWIAHREQIWILGAVLFDSERFFSIFVEKQPGSNQPSVERKLPAVAVRCVTVGESGSFTPEIDTSPQRSESKYPNPMPVSRNWLYLPWNLDGIKVTASHSLVNTRSSIYVLINQELFEQVASRESKN